MSISFFNFVFFIFILVLFLFPSSILADWNKPHKINFKFPNLYPEGLAWDPLGQQFLVGSLNQRIIATVSDAGVAKTFISDTSLPENVSFLGLAVDIVRKRLLAVVHAMDPLPQFDALAAYDLRSRQRLFLSVLPDADSAAGRPIANAVAADHEGNAYVTNAAGNYIWKVNEKGEASIFSRSGQYTKHPVIRDTLYSFCGLNGIAYVSKGNYLLVVQTNTGKMFKVDVNDGSAKLMILNEDLMGADGIAFRKDGVVLVVSPVNKLWYLKSEDGWTERGIVKDKIDLDLERFPTSVVFGRKNRAYVVYGHVMEGVTGNSTGREVFSIEEVKAEKSENEHIWVVVLVGLGFAYFVIWRFQMRRLVRKVDKVN